MTINALSGKFMNHFLADQGRSSTLTKGNKSLIRAKSSNGNSFISLDQADQADRGRFEQIKNFGSCSGQNSKNGQKIPHIFKNLLNPPPVPDLPDPKFANAKLEQV